MTHHWMGHEFLPSHNKIHDTYTRHPHTVETSGIFTTTGRILFYNILWKETFGKSQMHWSDWSEFQQWIIHLNTHTGPCDTGPSNFQKMWGLRHPWPGNSIPCTAATCKHVEWSTRIGRNMTIWILCLILGSGPGAVLPLEVTGYGVRSLFYIELPDHPRSFYYLSYYYYLIHLFP